MKKKNRKLSLNRETLRLLEGGLEHAVGGVSLNCPESVTVCGSGCPQCPSMKCEGGSFTCSADVCSYGTCSGGCATGGACTVGC